MVSPLTLQVRDRLRIGVVLGASVVPAWVAKILQDLRTSEFAQLTTVVLIGATGRTLWQRLCAGLSPAGLLRLYEAVDTKFFNAGKDALKPVDVSNDIAAAGVIHVDPVQVGGRFPLAEDVGRRLEAANLDVILNFWRGGGAAVPPGCARCGVWSVHQGNCRGPRGGPALFWEVLEQNPVSAAEVHVRTAPPGGCRVVSRSFSRTHLLSFHRTRNTVFWKSAEILLRRLRDFHARGWESIQALDSCTGAAAPSEADGKAPGALPIARFLAGRFSQLLGHCSKRLLFRYQWLLAVRRREWAGVPDNSENGFRLILPPQGRCYADPFIIKRDGKHYVFFEEYRFDRPKGVISCLEIDPSGNPVAARVVLERDYHLSYPFVFEWQGRMYLLPESTANRTVELYRAVDFPHRWVLDRVLLRDIGLTDATLWQQGDRFWLFACSQGQSHSVNDELNLYSADTPLGPWKPHPRNPVVADVRRARPAGQLFRANGRLFRPTQDCSVRYGYAVTFQRINVLTDTDYAESFAGRLDPGWLPGNLATHTFNHNEDFEVVDAQRELPRYAFPFRRRSAAGESSGPGRYGASVTTPLGRSLRAAVSELGCPPPATGDPLPAGATSP
jgi:hypothetical protein